MAAGGAGLRAREARSWPGPAQDGGDAAAPGGGAVQGHEGAEHGAVGGDGAAPGGHGRKFRTAQGFGQIGIGEEPGRAGQGGAQVQPAGQEDEAHAQDAVGAPGGTAVLRREGGPGERGGGVGEDGVHAGAGAVLDRAAAVAGVVREVGGEGGLLRVGQGGGRGGWGWRAWGRV